MPADVRINNLTTNVNVTDASTMLTPQVLERIVQAVLQRLAEQKRTQQQIDQDQSLGAMRDRSHL